MRQERPRIGICELSREDICKKEFLGHMNKVSPQNKDKILQKVIGHLQPQFVNMYCAVIWAILQRPAQIYQSLYAEIARHIAVHTPIPEKYAFREAWDQCWKSIVDLGGLMNVPDELVDPEQLSDECTFQEWIIWKKTRLNLARGCVHLCFYGVFTKSPNVIIGPIADAIEGAMNGGAPAPAHVLDYWIEVFSCIWETMRENRQPLDPEIMQKMRGWEQHRTKLELMSSRFKIQALIETLDASESNST